MIDPKLINFKIYGVLMLLLFVGGCQQNPQVVIQKEIQNFDITPDGEHIIFSWTNNQKVQLYKANIDGTNVGELLDLNKDLLAESPSCSSNGRMILFIARKPKSLKTSLWIVDIEGKNLKNLVDSTSLITEAVFSKDDQNIIFVRANEYTSYSPIGRKAPHNFDLYSLNLNNNKISKISSLNAYSLSDITEIDSSKILLSLRDKEDGIFFYNKSSSELNKITVTNDSLRNSNLYAVPVILNGKNIVAASSYQLVNINIETKKERQLLPSSGAHIKTLRYNDKKGLLFFTKTDDINTFHTIKKDGSDLRNINIILDN